MIFIYLLQKNFTVAKHQVNSRHGWMVIIHYFSFGDLGFDSATGVRLPYRVYSIHRYLQGSASI